jgi:shikimate kinase
MVGLMGSGKTVVGRRIALRIGWRVSDSDETIQFATRSSAREIKELRGASELHRREAAHLRDALASSTPSVVCAAASVVDDSGCRSALRDPAVCVVWLRARVDTLAERFHSEGHRPRYGERPDAFLEEQIAARTPYLLEVADGIVDVDGLTVSEVVAQVSSLVDARTTLPHAPPPGDRS